MESKINSIKSVLGEGQKLEPVIISVPTNMQEALELEQLKKTGSPELNDEYLEAVNKGDLDEQGLKDLQDELSKKQLKIFNDKAQQIIDKSIILEIDRPTEKTILDVKEETDKENLVSKKRFEVVEKIKELDEENKFTINLIKKGETSKETLDRYNKYKELHDKLLKEYDSIDILSAGKVDEKLFLKTVRSITLNNEFTDLTEAPDYADDIEGEEPTFSKQWLWNQFSNIQKLHIANKIAENQIEVKSLDIQVIK